jgi:hypothetical protein
MPCIIACPACQQKLRLAHNLKARDVANQLLFVIFGCGTVYGIFMAGSLLLSLMVDTTVPPSNQFAPPPAQEARGLEALRPVSGVVLIIFIFQLIVGFASLALLCWYLVRLVEEIDARKLGRKPATNLIWAALLGLDAILFVVLLVMGLARALNLAAGSGPFGNPNNPSFPNR